jgi:hypothetical protein
MHTISSTVLKTSFTATVFSAKQLGIINLGDRTSRTCSYNGYRQMGGDGDDNGRMYAFSVFRGLLGSILRKSCCFVTHGEGVLTGE